MIQYHLQQQPALSARSLVSMAAEWTEVLCLD
jgi:hypothetical protein